MQTLRWNRCVGWAATALTGMGTCVVAVDDAYA
jgi:hypothetical protein